MRACVPCAFAAALLMTAAGQTQTGQGQPPPAKRPESGMRGGSGPTTRPGSHESSSKDERDRIAGKYPAPQEGGSGSDRRGPGGAAASAAYVDVVVMEGQRQALTLTPDDFKVTIDGEYRRVVSVHYVFRGPQALQAGRSIPVGKGVVARGEEARTMVLAVDETSFSSSQAGAVADAVQHTLDLVGPADRSALVTLPDPAPIAFAADRDELLRTAGIVVGRPPAARGTPVDGLVRVLNDLARFFGPKNVLLFEGGTQSTLLARDVEGQRPDDVRLQAAAAYSRTSVHLVTAAGVVAPPALRDLALSTGGSVLRLTGDPRDLEPLAAVLLGGYVLQIDSRATDRDGRAHALVVTTSRQGARVLAASHWMPHSESLPAAIVH